MRWLPVRFLHAGYGGEQHRAAQKNPNPSLDEIKAGLAGNLLPLRNLRPHLRSRRQGRGEEHGRAKTSGGKSREEGE